jgi:hypothetical protein
LEQRLNQLERVNRDQARRLRSGDVPYARDNRMGMDRVMPNNRMDYRGDYTTELGPAALISEIAPRVAVQGGR